MLEPKYPMDPDAFLISSKDAKAAAKPYADAYQANKPYNHIGISDFLPPIVLERVLEELNEMPEPATSYSRAQENNKTTYTPERLPHYTRNLLYALNSRPFILFLEELTGIRGLIPDPYYAGAGIHQVANGGHLDIHADFNHHDGLNLERRLNVLIYLNKGWQEEWGGSFEIWSKDMSKKEASFVPKFNQMVCFSTGSDTFHGNPEPVNHPTGAPRRSIALYYYTATWDGTRISHTTLFKPRPGTADQTDWTVRRRAVLRDITPPIIYRRIIGGLSRVGF